MLSAFLEVSLVADKVARLVADRVASLELGQSLDKVASVAARRPLVVVDRRASGDWNWQLLEFHVVLGTGCLML